MMRENQPLTSPDTVTLSFSYNGSLPTSEAWTGKVEGSVSTDWSPDLLPRLQTVSAGGATDTAGFAYDRDGLLRRAGPLGIFPRSTNGLPDSTQVGTVVSREDHSGYGELANLRFRSGANVLLQQSIQRDALGRIVQVVDAAVDLSRGPAAWSGAPVHDVGPRPSRPILRFAIPPKKAKGGAVWRRPRSYEVDRPCEPGRSPLFPLHRHRSTLLGIELTGGSHRPDPNPGRRPRASRDRPHANRHRRSAWCERTRRSRPR